MNAPAKIEAATLHSAMAAAFGEIEAATKAAAGQVGQQKYKYADIGKVIEAIKPALINHQLFFTQHPQPSEGGVTIETMLHHAGGESMSLGSLFVPADRNNAQGFGSALTYARRYALVTAFGVPTEDDDGSAASKGREGQSQGGKVSPSALIDDAQWAEIVALMQATNANAEAFCQAYGVPSVKELRAYQFEDAKDALNKKLKKMKGKADA